jgi:IrrE N-terminal-like domain
MTRCGWKLRLPILWQRITNWSQRAPSFTEVRLQLLYVSRMLQQRSATSTPRSVGTLPEEIRQELTTIREQILTLEAEMTDYRREAPKGLSPVQRIIRRYTATAPVDIVGLAQALGIAVREFDLGAEVSGEIFPDLFSRGSSGYTIRVNAAHPLVRRRFTVAHELAHFLRHRNRISNRLVDDQMYRSHLGKTVEAEAEQLAATF